MKDHRLQGLYLISNHQTFEDQRLLEDVDLALQGGVKILQYRDKSGDQEKHLSQCRQLRKITADCGCLLIINDDAGLAQQVDADGVHLGQEDGNITHARQLLGDDKIIGVSCYNKIELASQAADKGADYIAFGRFFPSRTKPNAIQAHADILHDAKNLQLPVVAIGGISQDNAPGLIHAGADMIAVIDAIFGQSDIKTATQQFKNLFKSQG
jgi:thiamine-phosphate pyrophosphorylase